AEAAISFVGPICSANASATGATLSCQPGAPVATGDVVVVSIAWTSSAGSLSVTDGVGSYDCSFDKTVGTAMMRDVVCVRRLPSPLTSSNTITVTGPSGAARALVAFEFAGADPVGATEGSNGGTSLGTEVLSGQVTTPAGEVLEFASFAVSQ